MAATKKASALGNDYKARRAAKEDGRGKITTVKPANRGMGKNPIGSAPSKRAPHQ